MTAIWGDPNRLDTWRWAYSIVAVLEGVGGIAFIAAESSAGWARVIAPVCFLVNAVIFAIMAVIGHREHRRTKRRRLEP